MNHIKRDSKLGHFMARQGDVLIFSKKVLGKSVPKKGQKVPDRNTPTGKAILAFGEVTGHSHAVQHGSIFATEDPLTDILEVKKDTAVVHEEHEAINIPAADQEYIVRRQQEWWGAQSQQVRD